MSTSKKRTTTVLTTDQKAILCTMAKQAFTIEKQRYAVDEWMKVDEYRKLGQREACGIDSLTACGQVHFLMIRGYWHVILGNVQEAYNDFIDGEPDTVERKQMGYRVAGCVAAVAFHFQRTNVGTDGKAISEEEASRRAWVYAAKCAKGKTMRQMSTEEIEHLCHTLTNRFTAMRGKGNAANRNKKQRAKPPVLNGSEDPFERPLKSDDSTASFSRAESAAPQMSHRDANAGSQPETGSRQA